MREPQIAIKVKSSEKAIAGETVNFMVYLTNPGDGVAESVKLNIHLPEGLEHASGRRQIEFDVGQIAPQKSRTSSSDALRGSGLQTCTIAASGAGNIQTSDSSNIDILVPKLDVALAGPKLAISIAMRFMF